MSRAMVNIITKNTTKADMKAAYENYPDTQPRGEFDQFHASTVEPMFCEVPEGAKILDVGANSGEMMKLLRDAKGCEVHGVDISDTAIAIAKKKGIKILKADAEALPFPDASFDAVILREVLVHLHEPVKALAEIRRVLKPSGFLLGSAPHANLEKIVWDDKRLHHRYYNEDTLTADLSHSFEKTHLKVLTGAQFSIGFAESLLGDQPCELLWKSGGADVPPWEHALTSDTKTLRVWMGPTQTTGGVYYRMIGYAMKMRKMDGVQVGFEDFNFRTMDGCSTWQDKLVRDKNGEVVSSVALNQFEKCLKLTDPWVFQITYHDDMVALFETIKSVFPNKKFVTECDDWLFDVPAYNVASNPYRPNSEKEQIAWDQLQLSDACIVSTSFLKEEFTKLFPGKPIYVVPNSIDFEMWDNAKSDGKYEPKKDGVVRIAYTGCANHGGDMRLVTPVLLALLDEFPNLEVLIAQDMGTLKEIKHPRFKVLERWENIIDYPAMLKGWDFDIGIAPLRDNAFNRAKSNLRWLEYSALGIPTVASKVRPFEESVKAPEDGLLCTDKNQWYHALKLLITDEQLRKGIGRNAYERVKKDFNMDTVAAQYKGILEEIKSGSSSNGGKELE